MADVTAEKKTQIKNLHQKQKEKQAKKKKLSEALRKNLARRKSLCHPVMKSCD